MLLASFLFFMVVFVGIGVWATAQHRDSTEDYLLAGRNVHWALAGLSAMASLMSGFMFIGYIGIVYKLGLYATWFFLGELTGLLLLTPWLQKRIQSASARQGAQTVTAFLLPSSGSGKSLAAVLASLLTLVFLGIYAAAQLTAGGKALNDLFGWPASTGAIVGAAILLLYSYAGGIRASIWTDAAQSIVMLLALAVLCITGLAEVGGPGALLRQLAAIDPALVSYSPRGATAAGLYFFGWVFAGIAVFSLPHVMVRYMTIEGERSTLRAHGVFLSTVVLIVVLATTVALVARVMVHDLGDPELALTHLTSLMLPEIFIGLVLAGIFASSLSSADSMVLSSSAALSQHLVPDWRDRFSRAKLSTLLVISCVLLTSIRGPDGVFNLVAFAVGGMGSAFGPLLVLRVLGVEVGHRQASAMMLTGLAVAVTWRYGLGFSGRMFEAAPGVIAGFAVYGLGHCLGRGQQ